MARIFNNDTTGWTSSDKGKYYYDRDNNGSKGACDSPNDGEGECFVDVFGNIAEGNLKGTYVQYNTKGIITADGKVKPYTQAPVDFSSLYTYNDAADFKKRVDNSMAGQMRDCGECHVGGGAMEYVPVAQGSTLNDDPSTFLYDGIRNPLRTDPGGMLTGYNTFSYFIDQYDEDGDGILGEVLASNYSDTGVMEMDCLMCHMDGYSWNDRTEAIRKGNFDASRVAGAGLGTADNADGSLNINGAGLGTGYGKIVTYDPLMVEDDGGGLATLSAAALAAIEGTPPSANCSWRCSMCWQ